jgi:hypothetical protein
MSAEKGLLLVAMEPPASMEEEFNDWYDSEHFPQRCALPGFESGRRFVCLDGWPRYLALYDLTSTAALETAAYRAVSGGNSTPWSRRILPRTIGRQRVVARQVAPGDALISSTPISRLIAASFPGIPDTDIATFATALDEALAGEPGLVQARLFRDEAGEPGDLWIICAFDRPVQIGDLSRRVGALADHGAERFNIYAPYRRA